VLAVLASLRDVRTPWQKNCQLHRGAAFASWRGSPGSLTDPVSSSLVGHFVVS